MIDEYSPTVQEIYFAVVPNGNVHRLEATVNASPSICSSSSSVQIQVLNLGNQISSGLVTAVIDSELEIISVNPSPLTQVQNTISWEVVNMNPGDLNSFDLTTSNPNFESIGNSILSSVNPILLKRNLFLPKIIPVVFPPLS